MLIFIRFIFGAIVGSFLNVAGLRYRTGLSLGGRSSCAACATKLSWWQLVPIVSFLALRGRCAACKSRISWQYPLAELWTALIFATLPLIYWPAFCLYTLIAIYDIRHKIIPDALVYASIIYALIVRFVQGGSSLDWLAGVMLFALFALGWLLSKGRAVGFGDAKLVLSVGLLLGASMGISAIVLAFWVGTLVTIPFVLYRKSLTMKSEIPFAPFIILGAWGALLFHLDLFYLSVFQ